MNQTPFPVIGPSGTTNAYSGIPTSKALGASLWQFGLALVVLYLIIKYLPHGEEIAFLVFIGALTLKPGAAKNVQSLLNYIETGVRT